MLSLNCCRAKPTYAKKVEESLPPHPPRGDFSFSEEDFNDVNALVNSSIQDLRRNGRYAVLAAVDERYQVIYFPRNHQYYGKSHKDSVVVVFVSELARGQYKVIYLGFRFPIAPLKKPSDWHIKWLAYGVGTYDVDIPIRSLQCKREKEGLEACLDISPKVYDIVIHTTPAPLNMSILITLTRFCSKGTIYDRVRSCRGKEAFTLREIQLYYQQLIEKLIRLRDKKRIQGDLQPRNLLLGARELLVIDYEFSRAIGDKRVFATAVDFNAPEILLADITQDPGIKQAIDYSADLFSSGLILLYMLMGKSVGHILYSDKYDSIWQNILNPRVLKKYVEDLEKRLIPKLNSLLSTSPFLPILTAVLAFDPQKRPSLEKVMEMVRAIAI